MMRYFITLIIITCLVVPSVYSEEECIIDFSFPEIPGGEVFTPEIPQTPVVPVPTLEELIEEIDEQITEVRNEVDSLLGPLVNTAPDKQIKTISDGIRNQLRSSLENLRSLVAERNQLSGQTPLFD